MPHDPPGDGGGGGSNNLLRNVTQFARFLYTVLLLFGLVNVRNVRNKSNELDRTITGEPVAKIAALVFWYEHRTLLITIHCVGPSPLGCDLV